MLCNACQNQPHCLPARLAQGDDTLAAMLEQLKNCGVQAKTPSSRPTWLASLRQGLQSLWGHLRHWGQRWLSV